MVIWLPDPGREMHWTCVCVRTTKCLSCTTLNQLQSRDRSLCPCVLAFLCLNTECVSVCGGHACSQGSVYVGWEWKKIIISKREICKESIFFFFFFFSKRKIFWSPVCFFILQTGRRGEAEGFWGHGNKKAAGSCTFHSWLMSQWDDVSYQHSAHGGGRRKVYRG